MPQSKTPQLNQRPSARTRSTNAPSTAAATAGSRSHSRAAATSRCRWCIPQRPGRPARRESDAGGGHLPREEQMPPLQGRPVGLSTTEQLSVEKRRQSRRTWGRSTATAHRSHQRPPLPLPRNAGFRRAPRTPGWMVPLSITCCALYPHIQQTSTLTSACRGSWETYNTY